MPNTSRGVPKRLPPAPVASKMPWVQGMEAPSGKHQMRWEEVLLRRLLGFFQGIPIGDGTKDAEAALGFDQAMVYYYVGRCHPAFGYNILAAKPARTGSLTTPFDTGALADQRGFISTSPALDAAGRGPFVAANSYRDHDYEAPLDTWIDLAFSKPAHYVSAEVQPTSHALSEVVLATCTGDERVWTWEARVPAIDFDTPPVEPLRVLFANGTRESYGEFIDETTLLTSEEKDAHSAAIYLYSEEVNDPGPRMREYLCEELKS